MLDSLCKWSLCLLFLPFSRIALVLQIQTACVSLSVWNSHTFFSLESFLSYSVPGVQSLQLIGSTSLRFWNESPAFAQRLLSQRAAWETKESESYCFLFGVGEGAQIPMFEQSTFLGCNSWRCVAKITGEGFITAPALCSNPQAQSKWSTQTT